jgi:hypothetical protein
LSEHVIDPTDTEALVLWLKDRLAELEEAAKFARVCLSVPTPMMSSALDGIAKTLDHAGALRQRVEGLPLWRLHTR